MQAFTIPTIYTAVDKYSGVMGTMGTATQSFNNKIELLNSKSERLFKKLTPGISEAGKQMLSLAGTAGIVAGAFATAKFSVDSIMNYENALQSFRTIVSDLSDDDFKKFETAIGSVAKETKKSTIDVALAFEKIAGLNSAFAKTPEAISAVTSAAITLSRASRDDLGVSAENLVGILNQFSLGAEESNRVINVLAAGQAVGAASISNTSETFKVFGAVAKQSNLSLEQSVALTEVLASKQIMGAEAGTALRGTLVRLKASGLGYVSGLFNTKDALEEVNQKYNKLRTAKEKDALLDKVFGTLNLTTGSILMNNVKLLDQFTDGVTGTSEAQKAAAINSNTLSAILGNLSASWVNLITSSDNVNSGLQFVKDTLKYVGENMDTIVTVGMNVLKFFALWKASILVTKIAMTAYNLSIGVYNALFTQSIVLTNQNVLAQKAFMIASKLGVIAIRAWDVVMGLAVGETGALTAEMVALNAVMLANPVGLLIVGIAALVGGTMLLISQNEKLRAEYLAQQKLRLEQVANNEESAINKLTQSYRNLGYSIKDATIESLRFEKNSINIARVKVEADIAKNKADIKASSLGGGQIFGEFTQKHRKAKEDYYKNSALAADLAIKNQKLTELGVNAANSGLIDKKTVAGILDNSNIGMSPEQVRLKQLSALEAEGMKRPAINTKVAQANSMSTITKNNTNHSILTVKNESDNSANLNTNSGSQSIMPKSSSTVMLSAK